MCPGATSPRTRSSFRKSKSVSGLRRIPILPELAAEWRRWRDFQEARGAVADSTGAVHQLRDADDAVPGVEIVKRVAHRAGVRTQDPPDRAGLNLSEVSPHTLRRTFGSTLLNQGVRLEVVSKLLGHSNTKVTEDSYAELLNATIAREVLSL